MRENEIRQSFSRQVLIVEDDEINRELLGMIVGQRYSVHYAVDGADCLRQARQLQGQLSCILLDLNMPVMNGMEALQALRQDEQLRRIPVIVLTSETEAEVESLRGGAADFIKKPYNMPDVIMARIDRTIELAEDRHIISQVEYDRLTGLYTKDFFFEYAADMHARGEAGPMDAVVIDLDHFHLFNEMHGRRAGDQVLRRVADAIRQELSTGSIACRCEADTFYVYCPHRADHEEVQRRVAGRIASVDDGIIHVRMGVCARTDLEQDIVGRFDRARAACNTMRGNYLRCVAFYDEKLYQADIRAQRLISEMREAIERRQITVYYQPKYHIRGERPRLASAEALVRWQHPELGMVSPGLFIPLFERNGMIQQLDSYVWREAARQTAQWRQRFGRVLPISLNVSRIDLHDQELLPRLLDIRDEFGLPEEALLLEVTESAYTQDTEQAIRVISGLREAGFRIEMDDFGSGYSSLNMLLDMPIDAMKVDTRFTRALSGDQRNTWLIDILVDIARHLGVPTVFEGVEEEEQVRLIKKAGGDLIQGYYFSKPLPAEQFERLLEREQEEDR